jgi:hypothetical protein
MIDADVLAMAVAVLHDTVSAVHNLGAILHPSMFSNEFVFQNVDQF